MVQGAHALADYAIYHSDSFEDWHTNSEYLIFLEVRNEDVLKVWEDKLNEFHKLESSAFREPDLDNQLTAIACYDEGLIFKKLKLA